MRNAISKGPKCPFALYEPVLSANVHLWALPLS
jgi:hypothetical protein